VFTAYKITIVTKQGKNISCLSKELDTNFSKYETIEFVKLKQKVKDLALAAKA